MKTDIIKFSPSHFLHSQLITEHKSTTIRELLETKFLGVKIDNHLNWKYVTLPKHIRLFSTEGV